MSWALAELSGTLSGEGLDLNHYLQPRLTPGLHLTLCPLCPGPTLWLPQGLQSTGSRLALLLPALPRGGLLSSLHSDTTRQTGHRAPSPVSHGTSKLSLHGSGGRGQYWTKWMSKTSRGSVSCTFVICSGHVARKLSHVASTCLTRICNYHVDWLAYCLPFPGEGKVLEGRPVHLAPHSPQWC